MVTFSHAVTVTHSLRGTGALGSATWSTLALGLLAGLLAYRQWRTADTRLRLDLYAKRYPIYVAVRKIMAHVLTAARPTQNELTSFQEAVADAKFLFDPEMANYLWEFHFRADQIAEANESLNDVAEQSTRAMIARSILLNREWFKQQYKTVEFRFRPWLRVEQGFVRSLQSTARSLWRRLKAIGHPKP